MDIGQCVHQVSVYAHRKFITKFASAADTERQEAKLLFLLVILFGSEVLENTRKYVRFDWFHVSVVDRRRKIPKMPLLYCGVGVRDCSCAYKPFDPPNVSGVFD